MAQITREQQKALRDVYDVGIATGLTAQAARNETLAIAREVYDSSFIAVLAVNAVIPEYWD